jgi:hypothetical protein
MQVLRSSRQHVVQDGGDPALLQYCILNGPALVKHQLRGSPVHVPAIARAGITDMPSGNKIGAVIISDTPDTARSMSIRRSIY